MTNALQNQLSSVSENLSTMLQKKADALPRNFNETRFLQNCLTVLSETKDIEKIEPRSVARTMLKGAFLGLDFFNKECYAICYGGQLQFQTDYKGEIKLAKLYSINPIKDIYAKLVKKGDSFEAFIRDGKQTLNLTPITFNDEAVIGAFAVVYFQDGSMQYDEMSAKEIEATRKNYSKVPHGPAWTKSPGEMQKKTVLRRLCKLIEINFDNEDQRKAFEAGGDLDKRKITDTVNVKVNDPFKASEKPQDERKEDTVPQNDKEVDRSAGKDSTGETGASKSFEKKPSEVKEGPNGEIVE